MAEELQLPEPQTIEMIMARLDWDGLHATASRSERRSSRRLSLRATAELIGYPGAARLDVAIYDVSECGVGILTAVAIPVGTQVALQCDAGFVVGFVRRCDSYDELYRCGIALEDCVSTRATISDLLQRACEPSLLPTR